MPEKLDMKEAQLQQAVIDLAHRCGWRVAHFSPAKIREGRIITPVKADGAGFPDLVLVRKDRVIFMELKRKGRALRPEQEEWYELLRAAHGVEMHVMNVTDWESGWIEDVLR